MGMFDRYLCSGPAFVCSEGHDLSDEEFQGKSLSCTMADHSIDVDRLTIGAGYYGETEDLPRYTTTIFVGATCKRCPAFLQAGTFNMIDTTCDFAVTVEGKTGKVLAIERCSETTAEFLRVMPSKKWMVGALGPMPYDEAYRIRVDGMRKMFATSAPPIDTNAPGEPGEELTT